jgi:SAM-dependent methyltransferase
MTDPTRQFYETHADEYERQTKDLKPVTFLTEFMNTLPTGAKVLDLGCAYGRDTAEFIQHGYSVLGVDYSSSLIARAKELVPEAMFQVGDFRRMELEPQSFDAVWAYMCFLHLQKREVPALLTRLATAMKPSGIFAVGMKVGDGEGMIEDRRYEGALKYFAQYGEEEFLQLLKHAGFSVFWKTVRERAAPYQDKPILEVLARRS